MLLKTNLQIERSILRRNKKQKITILDSEKKTIKILKEKIQEATIREKQLNILNLVISDIVEKCRNKYSCNILECCPWDKIDKNFDQIINEKIDPVLRHYSARPCIIPIFNKYGRILYCVDKRSMGMQVWMKGTVNLEQHKV